MSNSYLNIVTFLLTTIFYYLALKPALPLSLYKDKEQYKHHISNNYIYLAIYVVLVILIQFMVNSSIIANSCGGNITENMDAAAAITFLPWILIFGVLVLVLIIYPGFKSAFSDVIGYYYVSSSASKILKELLLNKDEDIKKKITEDPNMTPENKAVLETAADTIIKICGNNSILINQIVPSNFEQYWGILTPLMKDKYKMGGDEADKIQSDLFELVVTRDNIGEAMWYIYTGLLLTSIVHLKITTKGCNSNPKIMDQKFLEQEQKAKEKEEQSKTSTA
jgi:hypothetical protein